MTLRAPKIELSRFFSFAFLCLSLTVPTPGAFAQNPSRETVYRHALPLYQYDATAPLAVKTVENRTISGARLHRFSYGSTHGQRVPALLFTPMTASAAHPVPCLVILHGLGGSKEMMAGLALFAAQSGYASLVIDEYGQGERIPAPPTKIASQAEELALTVRQTAVDVRRDSITWEHAPTFPGRSSASSAFRSGRSSAQFRQGWTGVSERSH